MISKIKQVIVVTVLFLAGAAHASVDNAAFEHGVQVGGDYVKGMIKLVKNDIKEGMALLQSSMQYAARYYGENHNESYFRGVIKGLEDVDLKTSFKTNDVDEAGQVFVLVSYYQLHEAMSGNTLFKKVAAYLHKQATPDNLAQLEQSFSAVSQQVNAAFQAVADEQGPLNQYA